MVNQKGLQRNIELSISYVGTSFFGWQIQPGVPTVQGVLTQKLQFILKDPHLKVKGSSRTDTGVHAHDQRVHFFTNSTIPGVGLKRALNRMLPAPIRVRWVEERPMDFSVRHHAQAKHYSYFLYNGRAASPFITPFLWEYGRPMDVNLMNSAAQHFVGSRCFKALQAAADFREESVVTIFKAGVSRMDDIIRFDVLGHRFLYHMVRNMVGPLVKVGYGEWSMDEFLERLNSSRREMMWITAPAKGLHLFEVFYGKAPHAFSPRCEAFSRFLALNDTGFESRFPGPSSP